MIIPTYNFGRYIREAIESVLAQTHKNTEVIVVDDGSTDETKKVVSACPEIQYFWQPNQGTSKATNVGVRLSKGEFFVCLGADDKLHPKYVELTLKEIMNDEKNALVYTATQEFGDSRRLLEPRKLRHRLSVLTGTGGQLGAALTRRKAFETVGGYDETLSAYEDWDFAIRLSLKGWRLKALNQPLHFRRVHDRTRNPCKYDPCLEQKFWFMKPYRAFSLGVPNRVKKILKTALGLKRVTPEPQPVDQRNYFIVLLDSCRYDVFEFANPTNMLKIGGLYKVYSTACWTVPWLIGFLINPHFLGDHPSLFTEPKDECWLPEFYQKQGYHTAMITSAPYLQLYKNVFNRGWSEYVYLDVLSKNKLNRSIHLAESTIKFFRPFFVFLHIMNLHEIDGTWMIDGVKLDVNVASLHFNKIKKVKSWLLKRIDERLKTIFDVLPSNTRTIILSDHGNVYGEDRFHWRSNHGCGHNPKYVKEFSPKLFEVPLIIGDK